MRNQHVWTETTADNERREVRATKFAGKWKIQSKLKAEETWTYHEPPELADLEALHDVVFRKYQRRRASFEDVQSLERLIAQFRSAS